MSVHDWTGYWSNHVETAPDAGLTGAMYVVEPESQHLEASHESEGTSRTEVLVDSEAVVTELYPRRGLDRAAQAPPPADPEGDLAADLAVDLAALSRVLLGVEAPTSNGKHIAPWLEKPLTLEVPAASPVPVETIPAASVDAPVTRPFELEAEPVVDVEPVRWTEAADVVVAFTAAEQGGASEPLAEPVHAPSPGADAVGEVPAVTWSAPVAEHDPVGGPEAVRWTEAAGQTTTPEPFAPYFTEPLVEPSAEPQSSAEDWSALVVQAEPVPEPEPEPEPERRTQSAASLLRELAFLD